MPLMKMQPHLHLRRCICKIRAPAFPIFSLGFLCANQGAAAPPKVAAWTSAAHTRMTNIAPVVLGERPSSPEVVRNSADVARGFSQFQQKLATGVLLTASEMQVRPPHAAAPLGPLFQGRVRRPTWPPPRPQELRKAAGHGSSVTAANADAGSDAAELRAKEPPGAQSS